MSTPSPLSSETAYAIAGVSLCAFGHWIAGLICLALAVWTSHKEREARRARERANVPADEVGARSVLPPIAATAPDPATPAADPWSHDAKR